MEQNATRIIRVVGVRRDEAKPQLFRVFGDQMLEEAIRQYMMRHGESVMHGGGVVTI